jgi:hypothetical protein
MKHGNLKIGYFYYFGSAWYCTKACSCDLLAYIIESSPNLIFFQVKVDRTLTRNALRIPWTWPASPLDRHVCDCSGESKGLSVVESRGVVPLPPGIIAGQLSKLDPGWKWAWKWSPASKKEKTKQSDNKGVCTKVLYTLSASSSLGISASSSVDGQLTWTPLLRTGRN